MRVPVASSSLSIFWISVVGLYLELLLIRWVSTEIRIFAYLQNTVLVVCFLGLGIGLFTSRRPISPTRGLLALLVLATALAFSPTRTVLESISYFLSVLGELNIWGGVYLDSLSVILPALLIGLFLTVLVMVLILEPFVPIGRLLGRLMDDHPRPIIAYSVNVAGSLAGVWLFVGLSWLNLPPDIWFAVLLLLVLPYFVLRRPIGWGGAAILAAVVALTATARLSNGSLETIWSPYQKLALFAGSANDETDGPDDYVLLVSNTSFQRLFSVRDSEDPGLSVYHVPPLLHASPRDVLIVGAGTGNDVSGALLSGARQVTAVEIDPVVVEFGKRYHPDSPYASVRVQVIVDDARSYFARADQTYDLITFGFMDAHTTTSMTNVRLDHYVYTRESITRAKELLREDGILCLMFDARIPFIIDRMATVLWDVFDQEPLVLFNGALLVVGNLDGARERLENLAELRPLRQLTEENPVELAHTTPPATDDWPYIYLESPRIPLLFALLAGLLGFLVFYARRTLHLPAAMTPVRWGRSNWHFFFLGAAFLLLEVQNISKAAVVLGNTWLVNAVIISGVLTMILLANVIVLRWPRIPLEPVYLLLVATVLGLYFLDLARFAFLPYPTKAALVGALTTLPMVFSGIAFARAFAVAEGKDVALGANLLGALVGAVLQSLSFLLGIKALLLVVAAFYLLAMLTRPERRRITPRAASRRTRLP